MCHQVAWLHILVSSDSCSAYENAECAANMAGCWFFFSKLDGLRGKELFHAAVDRRPNFLKHACVQISMHLFEEQALVGMHACSKSSCYALG